MSQRWGIDWYGPSVQPLVLEALAQLAPQGELMPWLHLYWEPGERWAPVERFVVANMVPKAILRAEHNFYEMMGETDEQASLYAELEGPNPRDKAQWDPLKGKMIFEGLPPNITQRQWLLYHQYGAHAIPVWIVEGSKAGHKRHFNRVEQLVLRMAGRKTAAPAPGSQRYAHPDTRVADALRRMDQLRAWNEEHKADWSTRSVREMNEKRSQSEEEFHAKLFGWLDEQLEDVA